MAPLCTVTSQSSAPATSACRSRRCSPTPGARSCSSTSAPSASRSSTAARATSRTSRREKLSAARRGARAARDDRLRRAPRRRRDPDRAADAALEAARARSLDRARCDASRSRPGSGRAISSCSSRRRIPGTTRDELLPILERGSGLTAGVDFHLAFSPERVDPGPHRPHDEDRAEGRRRHRRGLDRRCGGAVRRRDRQRPSRLVPRGGRADEAAREHLPLGQHRARQRARAALRPDGDRHLGGRRRRRDEAVRLHALRAGPGPRRALHPDRPLLPDLEGARVRLLDRFIELAGKVNQDMPYYCRSRVSQALNHGARQVAHGLADPRARRRLQGGHLRHARVARREADRAAPERRARRSPTTIRTSPPSPSTASSSSRSRSSPAPTTPS